MKTTQLIYKAFIFLILVCLTFTSNGCKDSDNDEDSSCQTFLECQHLTVWRMNYDGEHSYIRIIDSTTKLMEIYPHAEGPDCYEMRYFTEDNKGSIQIIENSKNKFEAKIDVIDNQYNTLQMTTANSGETLNLVLTSHHDDSQGEVETYVLYKSTINVDELPTCIN